MSRTERPLCPGFGRSMVYGLAVSMFALLGGCKPHYEGNMPTPDAIPVVNEPHRVVDANCIIDIYTLEEPFAGILQQQGLRAALDSIGAKTPITPPPTYVGDSPPRDIATGEYWYPTPISAGTFSATSIRAGLAYQLSQCLNADSDSRFLSKRDAGARGRDFASFRDDNDMLYVLYPSEKLLVAAAHVD